MMATSGANPVLRGTASRAWPPAVQAWPRGGWGELPRSQRLGGRRGVARSEGGLVSLLALVLAVLALVLLALVLLALILAILVLVLLALVLAVLVLVLLALILVLILAMLVLILLALILAILALVLLALVLLALVLLALAACWPWPSLFLASCSPNFSASPSSLSNSLTMTSVSLGLR